MYIVPTTKFCRRCRTHLPLTDFHRNRSARPHGISRLCKVCMKAIKNASKKQERVMEPVLRCQEKMRVLDRMVDFDMITQEMAQEAKTLVVESTIKETFENASIDEA